MLGDVKNPKKEKKKKIFQGEEVCKVPWLTCFGVFFHLIED